MPVVPGQGPTKPELPPHPIPVITSLYDITLNQFLDILGYSPDEIAIWNDLFERLGWSIKDMTALLLGEVDPNILKSLIIEWKITTDDFDDIIKSALKRTQAVEAEATAAGAEAQTVPGAPGAPAGGRNWYDDFLLSAESIQQQRQQAGLVEGEGDGGAGGAAGKTGAAGAAGAASFVSGLAGGSEPVPSTFGGTARDIFLGKDPGAAIEFLLQEANFQGPPLIRDFLTDQGDFFSALAGLTLMEAYNPESRFSFIRRALTDFLGGTGGVTGLENVRRLVSELDVNSPFIQGVLGKDITVAGNFMGTVLAPFLPDIILREVFSRQNLRREEIQYKAALARGYTGNSLQWLIDRGLLPWLAKSGQLNTEGFVAQPTNVPFITAPAAQKEED